MFSGLRGEVIGTYPPRGVAGNFFFWGYAFATGPQRIFGFTTYNGLDGKQLHMIRSHGLNRWGIKELLRRRSTWDYLDDLVSDQDRVGRTDPQGKEQNPTLKETVYSLQKAGLLTQDQPPRLAISVFDNSDSKNIAELCGITSRKIVDHFITRLNDLENIIAQCSFARCSRPNKKPRFSTEEWGSLKSSTDNLLNRVQGMKTNSVKVVLYKNIRLFFWKKVKIYFSVSRLLTIID